MTYGHFHNFICSSFDQWFYLKVEKQFEEPLVSFLEPKFKKNSNGEEENASLYDEYNEDIEVLNWKFHDQQKSIVGELYSKLFTEQEIFLNYFDSQIDSIHIVDTLNVILDVYNIHGRDNFAAQNHYEKLPFLWI